MCDCPQRLNGIPVTLKLEDLKDLLQKQGQQDLSRVKDNATTKMITDNEHNGLPTLHINIPRFDFSSQNVKREWETESVYLRNCGYRMKGSVFLKESNVTFGLSICAGQYDNILSWPIQVNCIIQARNPYSVNLGNNKAVFDQPSTLHGNGVQSYITIPWQVLEENHLLKTDVLNFIWIMNIVQCQDALLFPENDSITTLSDISSSYDDDDDCGSQYYTDEEIKGKNTENNVAKEEQLKPEKVEEVMKDMVKDDKEKRNEDIMEQLRNETKEIMGEERMDAKDKNEDTDDGLKSENKYSATIQALNITIFLLLISPIILININMAGIEAILPMFQCQDVHLITNGTCDWSDQWICKQDEWQQDYQTYIFWCHFDVGTISEVSNMISNQWKYLTEILKRFKSEHEGDILAIGSIRKYNEQKMLPTENNGLKKSISRLQKKIHILAIDRNRLIDQLQTTMQTAMRNNILRDIIISSYRYKRRQIKNCRQEKQVLMMTNEKLAIELNAKKHAPRMHAFDEAENGSQEISQTRGNNEEQMENMEAVKHVYMERHMGDTWVSD